MVGVISQAVGLDRLRHSPHGLLLQPSKLWGKATLNMHVQSILSNPLLEMPVRPLTSPELPIVVGGVALQVVWATLGSSDGDAADHSVSPLADRLAPCAW